MAYTVNKTDGSIFASIQDGTINTDSNIVIVGKNYPGYGEFISENFIHLLENAANDSQPVNPLSGQLWYDTVSNKLHVYSGSQFNKISSLESADKAPPEASIGDLWYDTIKKQLFIYTGSEYILVGPAFAIGQSTSGAIVDVIIDTNSLPHTVIKLIVDDEIIGIISKDPVYESLEEIIGYTLIKPGITLESKTSNPHSDVEPKLEGTARYALNLVDINGAVFTVEQLLDGSVKRSGDSMLGPLFLSADPTQDTEAATKRYVDYTMGALNSDPTRIARAGGPEAVMDTGKFLVLGADPVNGLDAATKQYVDNTSVSISGDTMTGALKLSGLPINNADAASKQYVDNAVIGAGSLPGGGTAGQHLVKIDSTNYNTQWETPSGGAGDYVLKIGDTMTGALKLSGLPVDNEDAVSKQYVDTYADKQTNVLLNSTSNSTINVSNPTMVPSSITNAIIPNGDGAYAAGYVNSTVFINTPIESNVSIRSKLEIRILGGIIDDLINRPVPMYWAYRMWIEGGTYNSNNTLFNGWVYFTTGKFQGVTTVTGSTVFLDPNGDRIILQSNVPYTIRIEGWYTLSSANAALWNGNLPTTVGVAFTLDGTAISKNSKFNQNSGYNPVVPI